MSNAEHPPTTAPKQGKRIVIAGMLSPYAAGTFYIDWSLHCVDARIGQITAQVHSDIKAVHQFNVRSKSHD